MDIDALILFLQSHTIGVGFCGAFFGGSSVTLFLATLSGQGTFSLWTLLASAACGNFCSDAAWYLVGRSRPAMRLLAGTRMRHGFERVNRLLDAGRDRHMWMFVLVKFMYGLRVLAVIYWGTRKYQFQRFAAYNGLAVLLINALVVLAGWAAGRGVARYVDLLADLRTVVTALVAVLILAHLFRVWLGRKLEQESCADA